MIKKKITNLSKKVIKKPDSTSKKGINFFISKESKVSKERLASFWENYTLGKFSEFFIKRRALNKSNYISRYNRQIFVFPITPTMTGTIRKISTTKRRFLKNYIAARNFLKKIPLKHSEISLVKIIDIKEIKNATYVLEQISPSISCHDLSLILNENKYITTPVLSQNRYASSFFRKLEENKISHKSFLSDLNRAVSEIYMVESKHFHDFDFASNNLIIKEYNPKTHKFKFVFIDFKKFVLNSSSF